MSLLEEITTRVDIDDTTVRLEQRRMALINQIHDYLEEMDLTQGDLAERMGKQDSQITRLLSSDSNPTLKTIVEIESALGKKLFTVQRNIPRRTEYISIFDISQRFTGAGRHRPERSESSYQDIGRKTAYA